MIFSVGDHIELIKKGLKTQTRRSSPRYVVGKTYAIQPGRTKPGIKEGRILITGKWKEMKKLDEVTYGEARREGNYTPKEFEELYEKLHPDWIWRWAYEFKFVLGA